MKEKWDRNTLIYNLALIYWTSGSSLQVDLHIQCNAIKNSNKIFGETFTS